MSFVFWIELVGESMLWMIFGLIIWRKFDRLDRGYEEIRRDLSKISDRMITKDDIAKLREAISPRGVIPSSN